MLRCALESVRSRCRRVVTSVAASESSTADESSRFASAFSKRIGLTLCGIVDEPVAPACRDLAEVAERDVGPDVGGEVVQHAVGVRDAPVELGLPVVRLDLGGERVPGEPERLDELARDLGPRDIRCGDDVRRERAGRARELAEVLARLDLRGDAREAVDEDRELLAHGRRRRGLAVRARRAWRRRGARRRGRARASMTRRYFGSHTSRTASRTVIA